MSTDEILHYSACGSDHEYALLLYQSLLMTITVPGTLNKEVTPSPHFALHFHRQTLIQTVSLSTIVTDFRIEFDPGGSSMRVSVDL